METKKTPRVLTNDERRAAEAAFSGRPPDSAWSESAKKVYDGLTHALPALPHESGLAHIQEAQNDEAPFDSTASFPRAEASKPDDSDESGGATGAQSDPVTNQQVTNRQQAIQAGFLIDVTAEAQKLGLTFPITITKPLWEVGIAPSEMLSDADKTERLRDILMAFRLRLAGQATLSPLIDFPAMLALPPGAVPQPVPLFAFIQADDSNRAVATLLLPNEVSSSIIPMN